MISIVCVYNDKDLLDRYLIRSLKNQTADYEIILVDNTKGKFESASKALNYGKQKVNTKYIMFVHQDIQFCSETWLENAEETLISLPKFGVAGVAGKSSSKLGVLTNIKHGNPPVWAGETQIKEPKIVQTLDECLFIIPKEVSDIISFDEEVCNDWHLYGVDYCLTAGKLGYKSYVIPMFLYHRSSALSLSKKYYVVLQNVLRKHKCDYKFVYTTMGDWNASRPFYLELLRKEIIYLTKITKNFLRAKLVS